MNGSSCLLIEQRDHGQVKSRRKSRKRLKSCRIILWLQVLLGMAYPILCTRYTLRHQNPKITSFTVGSQTTKAIKWLETRLSISQEEGFTYTSQDKQSFFDRTVLSKDIIMFSSDSFGRSFHWKHEKAIFSYCFYTKVLFVIDFILWSCSNACVLLSFTLKQETYAFDNDFPALSSPSQMDSLQELSCEEAAARSHDGNPGSSSDGDLLFQSKAVNGKCRVKERLSLSFATFFILLVFPSISSFLPFDSLVHRSLQFHSLETMRLTSTSSWVCLLKIPKSILLLFISVLFVGKLSWLSDWMSLDFRSYAFIRIQEYPCLWCLSTRLIESLKSGSRNWKNSVRTSSGFKFSKTKDTSWVAQILILTVKSGQRHSCRTKSSKKRRAKKNILRRRTKFFLRSIEIENYACHGR